MTPVKATPIDNQPKALMPVKAGRLDPDEEDAFWRGKKPWRLLAVPFGGPIPSPVSPRGVDYDGEFFDERSDIFGSIKALRESKERLVDWHHLLAPPRGGEKTDPAGRTWMDGKIIGKAILDDEPDEDGWWVDFWFREGEKRVNSIRRLAERGAQLFGSTQALPGTTKRDPFTGYISVWPFAIQTLSTSPQNTYSVLRPAKAMLGEAEDAGIRLENATKAWLAELDQAQADLKPTSDVGEATARMRLSELSREFDEMLRTLRS